MKHAALLLTAVAAAGVTFILLNFPRFRPGSDTPAAAARKGALKHTQNAPEEQPEARPA